MSGSPPQSVSAAPSDRGRRRTAVLGLVAGGALSMLALACGDDPNDAPGGSAPPTSASAASAAPDGTGPASSGQLSPEARDEAHPTTPNGPPASDVDP